MQRPSSITLTAALAVLLLSLITPQHARAYTDHRNARVDSAEQVLQSGRRLSDKELMDCYYTIVRGTLGKDTEKHNRYAREMLALTYRMNALNMRENALNHLGLQHYGQERYQEAEHYFRWAIAVTDSMQGDSRYSQEDIDDNYSQLYGALGNLYNIQDKALLAIEYYQKALPIFERHGWLESQTILHHNVAELWLSMGNREKAETEYLAAIKTGEASGDSLMAALPRKGLVKIYIDEDRYEQALATAEQAYAYYHRHQNDEPQDYAEILASLTKIHLTEGHKNLAKARRYSQEALTIAAASELMFESRADIHAAAAMLAIEEGHWQEALGHALQSVHENDSDATYTDTGCYELLANIYMHLGQHEKAALYMKKIRRMMERFATEGYQSGLSQMEVIYETEKKEAEIRQLRREKQWYLWGGLLTALVLLLAASVFFLLWRSIRLSRRATVIQARLDGEITERVRIARDLHDRLGGLLTAIRLEHPTPLVDEAIGEMRNVSHHLLPDSLARYGLRTALSDYCRTMRNVSFTFVGQERRIPHEDTVYCIVYELVNNAVKSAQAQHISVELMEDEALTVVTVADDGKGLPPGIATDSKPRKADGDKAQTAGSGLRNIRDRVSAIGGTFTLKSVPDKGTEATIELPDCKNPQLGDCQI